MFSPFSTHHAVLTWLLQKYNNCTIAVMSPSPTPPPQPPPSQKKEKKKRQNKSEAHLWWEDTWSGAGAGMLMREWCSSGRRGRVHRDGRRERRGWGGVGGPICCSDRGACRTRESYWQLIGLRNSHSLKQHLNKSCLNFWRLMLYVSQLSFTDCIILVFTQFVGNT